jgi:hypothetical protein
MFEAIEDWAQRSLVVKGTDRRVFWNVSLPINSKESDEVAIGADLVHIKLLCVPWLRTPGSDMLAPRAANQYTRMQIDLTWSRAVLVIGNRWEL